MKQDKKDDAVVAAKLAPINDEIAKIEAGKAEVSQK